MPIHRLTIQRDGRHLGHFESEAPWAADAVREFAALLQTVDGLQLRYEVAEQARRIVESGPTGVRILSVQPIFSPAALPA